MVTTIDKFKEAYATMTVAIYEPLILQWISGLGIQFTSNILVKRLNKKTIKSQVNQPLNSDLSNVTNPSVSIRPSNFTTTTSASTNSDASGFTKTSDSNIPFALSPHIGTVDANFDFKTLRNFLKDNIVEKFQIAQKGNLPLGDALQTAISQVSKKGNVDTSIFNLLPMNIEEFLSPIGIAHYYRQLYFYLDEGFGPIEQCFTVAPKESLEVAIVSTKKQIFEEMIEMGSEQISENAYEEKNSEEISDKVSSMMQRDTNVSMSLSASSNVGIWQAGAQASTNLKLSQQKAQETATKKLKETTKRASERITKSYSIKTRSYQEYTDVAENRRVIKNEGSQPVNYALRRIYNRIRVKVQDLGPQLVWQLYLRNPGRGLKTSTYVKFKNSNHIIPPDGTPPGFRERPKSGQESGVISAVILNGNPPYVTLKISTTSDRYISRIQIDSITDLEDLSKSDNTPAPLNTYNKNESWDESTHTKTVDIGVIPGDANSVSIAYTYFYEPSAAATNKWEADRVAELDKINEEKLKAEFENQKNLITQISKIKPRPATELRKEERYEVMNRMISYLFANNETTPEPAPIEIEMFHRYFDIEALFITNHPSWWKPHHHSFKGAPRQTYPITQESEPAKLGSSLGWEIQIDGDNRRNEFLNSPWARVCLPIRANREREALEWLAKHIEGSQGFSLTDGPIKLIVEQFEKRRDVEKSLGQDGQDYVTISSTVGAPNNALMPESVYPIIQEFDVTVPTEGFVYDQVFLKNPLAQPEVIHNEELTPVG